MESISDPNLRSHFRQTSGQQKKEKQASGAVAAVNLKIEAILEETEEEAEEEAEFGDVNETHDLNMLK